MDGEFPEREINFLLRLWNSKCIWNHTKFHSKHPNYSKQWQKLRSNPAIFIYHSHSPHHLNNLRVNSNHCKWGFDNNMEPSSINLFPAFSTRKFCNFGNNLYPCKMYILNTYCLFIFEFYISYDSHSLYQTKKN